MSLELHGSVRSTILLGYEKGLEQRFEMYYKIYRQVQEIIPSFVMLIQQRIARATKSTKTV